MSSQSFCRYFSRYGTFKCSVFTRQSDSLLWNNGSRLAHIHSILLDTLNKYRLIFRTVKRKILNVFSCILSTSYGKESERKRKIKQNKLFHSWIHFSVFIKCQFTRISQRATKWVVLILIFIIESIPDVPDLCIPITCLH